MNIFDRTTEEVTQNSLDGEQVDDGEVVADEKPVRSFIDWVLRFGNPGASLR